ncbi:C1 family peptidase [Holzapfeliella floricola]|uniref:Aminopeptidase n=1 Tax=Holzapfeliella floricola DSM 23037 = JCM 16512 TaxID=1423744 RepID=A0A0R2DJG7_9LACO|nr:C1 family peptidase [Holzapfeliella floricola]KRN04248.1 aminopeptidase C [Holzapfeliella floricola DSM 23037 = JCM 16512]
MSKDISQQDLAKIEQDFAKYPSARVLQRAVMTNGINASSQNMDSQIAMDPTFSVEVATGEVSNQKQSGRCWMFAALNTMRHPFQKEFKVNGFELSQNYTFFWDKFEKANFFYENVIETSDLPLGDRKVDFLLTTPQQDGGQWDMLVALVQKYGLVPKSVMPETFSATKSAQLNKNLNLKLRRDAVELRRLMDEQTPREQVESRKNTFLSEVYRMLAYALGNPPKTFDFEYRDTDKKYHRDAQLTPQSFFEKYIGWNLEDYVSVINAPTENKPFNQVYNVELLGNVVGGREVRHLNLEIEELKRLTIAQLEAGETVWFGSDVGQSSDRQAGIMDTEIYKPDELFDVDLHMTKGDRLDYAESLMTHAMVITGVDLVEGQPTRWKVENSWGDKVGHKGYFVMSDSWFEEFTYQVVINKKFLTADQKDIYENSEAHVLAPWDPMGALAE